MPRRARRRYRRSMGAQPRQPGPQLDAEGRDEVLERVSQVVLAVARQLSVRDVLQMIVRSARTLADARYAALGVPDEHDSFAEFVVDGISPAAAGGDRPAAPPPRHARRHAARGPAAAAGRHPRRPPVRGLARRPPRAVRRARPCRSRTATGERCSASSSPPASAGPAASPSGTSGCSACSPRTPPSRCPTPGSTSAAASCRCSRSAPGWPGSCTTRCPRSCSACGPRPRAAAGAGASATRSGRWPRSAAWPTLAGQAHAELRAVIDGLAPPDLAAGGLAGSLRSYARLAGHAATASAVRVDRRRPARARRRAGGGGVPGRPGGAAQRAAPLRRRRGRVSLTRAPGPGHPGGGRRRPGLRGRGPARRPGPARPCATGPPRSAAA